MLEFNSKRSSAESLHFVPKTVARRILLKHRTLGHFSAQNLPRVSVTLITKVSLCRGSQRPTQADPSCLVSIPECSPFTALKSTGLYLLKIVFTSLSSLQPNFFNTLSQLNVPNGYYESKPTLSTTTQNACSFSFFFLLHFSLPSIPHLFTIIFCFGLSSSLECELHKSFCSLLYPHSLGGKKVH